jgi:hypothetical protein
MLFEPYIHLFLLPVEHFSSDDTAKLITHSLYSFTLKTATDDDQSRGHPFVQLFLSSRVVYLLKFKLSA